MYPFGSGMPQPQSNSPYGNNPPAVGLYSNNQSYPQNPQSAPYPTFNNPYPQNPLSAPYPPSHNPYPQNSQSAPYPPSNIPYPQHPQSAPYPPYNIPYPQNPQSATYPFSNIPYSQNSQSTHYPPFKSPYPQNDHSAANHPSSFNNNLSTSHTIPFVPHSFVSANGFQQARTAGNSCMFPTKYMTHEQQEGTPTVFADQQFDPVKDAHALRKAMKGFGTDEDALINIICRRSNEQRQEIQRQYKTHFGKDLIEDIKSETSGNFEKLLVGLLRPIVDFYCGEIKDAMAGIGTDEDVLIEILCSLSNAEIHIIKNQYLRLYGAHLESELKSETSGNFKRLLVSLCAAARDESGHVDPVSAQNDARELLKAGELRVGTDESMFNMILCQRNYQQLKLIFEEYKKMTGHSLEKAIKKEFSGDIMEGLIAIFKCVSNKSEYFASRLHKSMAGIGTNDKQLIRVIITRSEIDMADIKTTFERMYSKSLKSWIKGDTSGHYKHALFTLIGEQK